MADRKQALNPPSMPNAAAFGYSQATRVGDLVFCSGQVGTGDTVEDQAREAFVNLRTLLGAAGARLTDVVKLTVYTTDATAWEQTAGVRAEFLPAPFPAATVVVVNGLRDPATKLSLDVIAVVGSGR